MVRDYSYVYTCIHVHDICTVCSANTDRQTHTHNTQVVMSYGKSTMMKLFQIPPHLVCSHALVSQLTYGMLIDQSDVV